ncbi:MAG: hypothetical protein ONB48_03655 [candidate division KSB1 bacterium]|nr:hypothetical protein [candidate division KSB1 bacterium]MDZ7274594.1 hypothetical protein [candidate division KSB1 bacterium]MDZ7284745.1 hypothetical protein [candidate division KSB1 bacterium]MDZ7297835.1 hypothetical protein [candidate division KSB1 bacterium]MDZ7308876.1 hypothetical protein [candidate division KSB1 bacterium]
MKCFFVGGFFVFAPDTGLSARAAGHDGMAEGNALETSCTNGLFRGNSALVGGFFV